MNTSFKNTIKILEESIDHIPLFIAYVSKDLRYKFANKYYCNLFNVDCTEKIIDKKVEDLLGMAISEKLRPNWDRVLTGETVKVDDVVDFSTLNNLGEKYLVGKYIPHFGDDNSVDGFLIMVRITDKKTTLTL